MAAAVQATRTYLRVVIGLGINAEGTLRANTIIDEGLDNLQELHELPDDDGVKTLCANVRKQAGTAGLGASSAKPKQYPGSSSAENRPHYPCNV